MLLRPNAARDAFLQPGQRDGIGGRYTFFPSAGTQHVNGQPLGYLRQICGQAVRPVGRDGVPRLQAGVVDDLLPILPVGEDAAGDLRQIASVTALRFRNCGLVPLPKQRDDLTVFRGWPPLCLFLLPQAPVPYKTISFWIGFNFFLCLF